MGARATGREKGPASRSAPRGWRQAVLEDYDVPMLEIRYPPAPQWVPPPKRRRYRRRREKWYQLRPEL